MKIGVLCDHGMVSTWQARALDLLGPGHDIVLYNCTNGRAGPRRAKHGLYYVLNVFTIRNPLTRAVAIGSERIRISKSTDFEAEHEGLWQRLPSSLLREIAADRPEVILKFGMSLLRIPPASELAPPILSYHHGDPDHYRGRPAGFWESLHGTPVMGQIVQILSNKLDAGEVVAFAETKVYPHSYRATLMEAYKQSPLILPMAIANALDGTRLPKPCQGTNYRLPSNATVLKFCLRMGSALVRHIGYGAFVEKGWQVSLADASPEDVLRAGADGFPPPSRWRTIPIPPHYNFLADPFFAPDGDGLILEALHSRSGKGELVQLGESGLRRLSDPARHHSYPAALSEGGAHYLIPEVSLWSPGRIYKLSGEGLEDAGEIDLPGRPALLDPTMFGYDGRLYLFASLADEGSGVLRLWHAPSLFGRFEEHACAPIRISPSGARMAGMIVRSGEKLLRFGQDFSADYGNGLIIFRIDELSPTRYRETLLGPIRFEEAKGPHTLNFGGGSAVFDWYRERYSLMSGVRRFRGRLNG